MPKNQPKALRGAKYPKPSKSKPKPPQGFSVKTVKKSFKNDTAWLIVVAFCLGSMVECFAADPSDFIFFLRMSTGKPLSSIERVFFWYGLTTLFMGGMALIAIIGWKTHWFKPSIVIITLIGLSIVGGVLSILVQTDTLASVIIGFATTTTVLLETLLLLKIRKSERR